MAQVKSLLNQFGWKNENLLDVGEITSVRGSESIFSVCLHNWGAVQNDGFSLKIVSQ